MDNNPSQNGFMQSEIQKHEPEFVNDWSEDGGIIMKRERLTIEEMERKYPDMWLFITHCEFSENTKLVAGVVSAYSKSRDEINDTSSKYEGGAAIRYTGSILDGRIYLL